MKEARIREERIKAFNEICHSYIVAFCAKHDLEFNGWVANRVGEVSCIGDQFIYFDDIRYDIDNDCPEGEFFDWYFYHQDCIELGLPRNINYRSWCMGAKKPYSVHDLELIRQEVAER